MRSEGSSSGQRKSPFSNDEYGGLTIHNAVLRGIPEVVLKLVEGGVDINSVGNGGATPLHMAAISEPGQHIVDTLVRLGADPHLEDEFGYTPLHRFTISNLIYGAASVLTHGADPNHPGPDSSTPLHLCAALEHGEAMAEILLSFGANPLLTNNSGQRPLDVATQAGTEAVQKCLEEAVAVAEKFSPPDGA